MFKVHYSKTEAVATQACNCNNVVKVALYELYKRHVNIMESMFLFPTSQVKCTKVANY